MSYHFLEYSNKMKLAGPTESLAVFIKELFLFHCLPAITDIERQHFIVCLSDDFFLFFVFNEYSLYPHFKCYSPFTYSYPPSLSACFPLTTTSLPQCLGIPVHWETHPHLTKGLFSHWCQQCCPLRHKLEPWVSPCVLTGWCFSPWEFLPVWLVDNVILPMGVLSLSATSVLSLVPSLGTPFQSDG